MNSSHRLLAASLLAVAATTLQGKDAFTDNFAVGKADLAPTGTNRFFILAPGYQQVLEGREQGRPVVLTITVTEETRVVDGVETRVVVEHETAGGQVVEISTNYFAISRMTTDVFYFGEDVDMFKDGKVISRAGSWRSGVNGARFGMQMPGTPLLGARYYQEVAPQVALDRAEVTSLSDTQETPAGKFQDCLTTAESSGLERAHETKTYAPGVGLVFDGSLKLTRFGFNGK